MYMRVRIDVNVFSVERVSASSGCCDFNIDERPEFLVQASLGYLSGECFYLMESSISLCRERLIELKVSVHQ